MRAGVVAIALVALAVAQAAVAAAELRRSWWRAAVGLLVAPLGVYWAWTAGAKRRVYAWVGALVIYTLAIAVAAR